MHAVVSNGGPGGGSCLRMRSWEKGEGSVQTNSAIKAGNL